MTYALQNAVSALHAFLVGFTQDTRLLRLTTALGPNVLVVEKMQAWEGLSRSFSVNITALSVNDGIDIRQLLGQPALLEILTQHSRTRLRPFHGHATACERLSSDGGLTRYQLTLEPWLAFLRYRHDCFVWQGKTTLDIVAEIFSDYQGQGTLHPAWRIAVTDLSHYQPREVCTQFEESDLHFVERLLAEEGLFYWFEHSGDANGTAFGSHTLVISDTNTAFSPNQ